MLYKYIHLDTAEQLALHSIACVGFVRTFVPFILVRVCVCVPDHVPLCPSRMGCVGCISFLLISNASW